MTVWQPWMWWYGVTSVLSCNLLAWRLKLPLIAFFGYCTQAWGQEGDVIFQLLYCGQCLEQLTSRLCSAANAAKS